MDMNEEQMRKIEEVRKFVNADYSRLYSMYGDTSNQPSTLNMGQQESTIYLSTMQTDLLLLVNVKSVPELLEFIQNCGQFPVGLDIGEVTEENLEEKKREVFKKYLDTYIDFKDLAEIEKREGLEQAERYKLMKTFSSIGLTEEELQIIKPYLEGYKLNKSAILKQILSFPNGEAYLTRINHFMSFDYENVRSLTYDQIVGLDSAIKRDAAITGFVGLGAKFDMTMKYGPDGNLHFDSYYLDRMLKYCKLTGKHMRLHSLFDRLTAKEM